MPSANAKKHATKKTKVTEQGNKLVASGASSRAVALLVEAGFKQAEAEAIAQAVELLG